MSFAAATSSTALLFGIQAISTGIQAFAQIQQGRQEAEIFKFNARVAEQQAQLIRDARGIELDRQRRRAREFTASQEAAFAAAGVRLTGSPLQVMMDSAAELALDLKITEFNSKIAELNAITSAETQLLKAQQASTSGFIAAGTTLLTQLPSFLRFGQTATARTNPSKGIKIPTLRKVQSGTGTQVTQTIFPTQFSVGITR